MRAVSIIGGRPNLIKAGPVHSGLANAGIHHEIIDTGVYRKPYGPKSFRELGLLSPVLLDNFLENEEYISSIKLLASQFKHKLETINPDFVIIYGDLNPGVAASISALISNIPCVHVEAGLRNYDLTDTEEINRLIIDRFSKFLFCTSSTARDNLLKEGYSASRVFVVGNTIIAALKQHIGFADFSTLVRLGLSNRQYGLVTIHREENLTSKENLGEIIEGINLIQQNIPLVFVQYSSTIHAIDKNGQPSFRSSENLKCINTLSYHEYLGLLSKAKFIFTDSSGIQDEATYLGIPCLTCRETTHRIDTLISGGNHLVPANAQRIYAAVRQILDSPQSTVAYPNEWDLDVGGKIASIIKRLKDSSDE